MTTEHIKYLLVAFCPADNLCYRGYNDPWSAKPTLEGMMFSKGSIHSGKGRMLRKSLNSGNLTPLNGYCQEEAAAYSFSIQQYCT
jgi:hypothetical protein